MILLREASGYDAKRGPAALLLIRDGPAPGLAIPWSGGGPHFFRSEERQRTGRARPQQTNRAAAGRARCVGARRGGPLGSPRRPGVAGWVIARWWCFCEFHELSYCRGRGACSGCAVGNGYGRACTGRRGVIWRKKLAARNSRPAGCLVMNCADFRKCDRRSRAPRDGRRPNTRCGVGRMPAACARCSHRLAGEQILSAAFRSVAGP